MLKTKMDLPVKIVGITKVDEHGQPVYLRLQFEDGRQDQFHVTYVVADNGDQEVQAAIKAFQVELAKAYFDSEGWEKFAAWAELSERGREMAVMDRIASARHASVLLADGFKLELVEEQ